MHEDRGTQDSGVGEAQLESGSLQAGVLQTQRHSSDVATTLRPVLAHLARPPPAQLPAAGGAALPLPLGSHQQGR